jgi:short subunit fatty acids transporter
MLGVRLGVVGILAREDVKVLTVYVDLSVICVGCVDCVICVICSGGLSGSISRDSSTSNSQQTTHHNTSLTATNINLNTTQNTKIKGANLQAICCFHQLWID